MYIDFRRDWPLLKAPLLPSDSDFGQLGRKESCWMTVVWQLLVQVAGRHKTICCGFSLLEVVWLFASDITYPLSKITVPITGLLGTLNQGKSPWKLIYMGTNLNAVQKISLDQFVCISLLGKWRVENKDWMKVIQVNGKQPIILNRIILMKNILLQGKITQISARERAQWAA